MDGVGRGLVAHVKERIGHCDQAKAAQALRRGVDQHPICRARTGSVY
jgi:hypothetical protein